MGRPASPGAALARHGALVVLADVDRHGVESTARELSTAGRVSAAVVDVTDTYAASRLISGTAAAQGRLDDLFNDAGIAVMRHARRMTHAAVTRLAYVRLGFLPPGAARDPAPGAVRHPPQAAAAAL